MANNNYNILRSALAEQMNQEELLRTISVSLQEIVDGGVNISQSSMNDVRSDIRNANNSRARDNNDSNEKWKPNRRSKSGRQIVDDFTDEFEAQFMQGLVGDPIKKVVGQSIADLANQLGVSVDELGKEVGKQLGQQAAQAFKQNPIGQRLSDELSSIKDFGIKRAQDAISKLGSKLKPADVNGASNIVDFVSKAGAKGGMIDAAETAGKAMSNVSKGAELVTTATTELGPAVAGASAAFPWLTAAIIAGVAAVELLSQAFGPAIEGAKAYAEATKKAANANRELEKYGLKQSIDRMTKDINSMIEASYDVMKDAANKMMEVWDSALGTVTSTQGYTKADVQDLLSAYAQRLQSEGLSSVVSTADILDSLEGVLKSGLSGQVAEEFSYIATVLNKAVPTEDFFQYASTYASIAANQIAQGKSQSEALEYANSQLEEFANNLLYSSRELAGGFSSGLTNASQLFQDANRIATASKTGQASTISGVLTSVSAIVGAIAPDLSSNIVSNIVDAALGGNSDTLTAIRSLAGTGASNTAFLKQLASNPQAVFATLFSNLSKLQQMSNDNFMEVAEGLSQTFGVSMEAFARVDFNALANAISSMNLNSDALNQNMKLLTDGQTTSTAEQLRMQQINQYMLEEGLAYVLDNEVARAVQEHMWEEQLALEMQEATYGIEIQGATLQLFEGIAQTLENIWMFLHPIQAIRNKIEAISLANAKGNALQADLNNLIERGKVGTKANIEAYRQLTSRNQSLNLTKSYLELMGSKSYSSSLPSLSTVGVGTDISKNITNILSGQAGLNVLAKAGSSLGGSSSASRPTSKYSWGNVGKSFASSALSANYNTGSAYAALDLSPQEQISNAVRSRLQKYLDSMESYVKEGGNYEGWLKQASSYGITDLDAALSDYGLSESDAKAQFNAYETQAAAQYAYDMQQLEIEFHTEGLKWYKETWPEWDVRQIEYQDKVLAFQDALLIKEDDQIKELVAANKQLKEFYDEWIDYYINHTLYSKETLNAYDAAQIRNAEKAETGDAVLALADALTSNAIDLKDPAVQTNVLLAQILKIVEAIMQLENNTTDISLPTALSALGLGVTSES